MHYGSDTLVSAMMVSSLGKHRVVSLMFHIVQLSFVIDIMGCIGTI